MHKKLFNYLLLARLHCMVFYLSITHRFYFISHQEHHDQKDTDLLSLDDCFVAAIFFL